jgi:hypothetical protein
MENEMQSPDVGRLFEALSKAQGQMEGAIKDAKNPFFQSDYATLHSVWAACRKQLSANGLSVIQTTEVTGDVTVITTLGHSSGQWIRGKLSVKPQKADAQALGSCITYLRRYALAAIVGLSPADDDAEGTIQRPNVKVPSQSEKFIAEMTAYHKKLGEELFVECLKDNGVQSMSNIRNIKDAELMGKILTAMKFLTESLP